MSKGIDDTDDAGTLTPDLFRGLPLGIRDHIQDGLTITSDGRREYFSRDGSRPFRGEPFIDIDPHDPTRMLDLFCQNTGVQARSMEEAQGKAARQQASLGKLTFTPEKILANQIDTNRLSYFELMWYQKICRSTARDGTATGMSIEHIDIFYRKSFQALLRALSIAPSFPDLLLVDILNGASEEGLVQRYPKEIENLLILGILKGGKYEFFDTLYKLKKSRGELADIIKFVYDNVAVLMKLNLWHSSCFQELISDPSQDSQKMRLMYSKHTYLHRKSFMDKVAYFFINLLCASGNYREAEKVLREIESDAAKSLPKYAAERAKALKLMESMGMASGRMAELTPDDTDTVKRIVATAKDAFSALIPPFCLEGFTGNDLKTENRPNDPNRSPADTQKVTRRAMSLLDVSGGIMIAASEGVEQTIAVIKKARANPNVAFGDFYETLKNALMCFADVPSEDRDFEGLLAALKREEIPVPQEILNVCTARVCERRFQKRDFEGVIACYEADCANPNAVLLRGSAYYAMKSYFELAVGDGANIGKGVAAICPLLPQFQGTEWEEEIWECYVLPHYFEHRELLSGASSINTDVPLRVLNRQLSAAPDLLENHLKLLLFLTDRKKKKFPIKEYNALMKISPTCSVDPAIEPLLSPLHRGAVAYLCTVGQFKEACELIAKIPDYKVDSYLVQKRFDLLIHASVRTAETIAEAESLAQECPDFIKNSEARLVEARAALSINTYRDSTYLSTFESLASNEELTRSIFGAESRKQVFLAREMHRVTDVYQGLLKDDFFAESLEASAGAEFEIKSEILHKCGVRTASFRVQKNKILINLTVCEDERRRVYNRVQFVMDKNFNLVSPSDMYSFISLERRLYYLLFQAGLMEEIYNVCMEERNDDFDQAFANDNPNWTAFRSRFKNFAYSPDLFTEDDVRRVAEGNLDTAKILEEFMGRAQLSLLSSYNVEFDGLSDLYRGLIEEFRDLDDPEFCYRSRVDPSNPVSACRCAKFVAFYNSTEGAKILQQQGVPAEVVQRLGLPKAEKNNLVGYFEIVFFFPKYGEKKISLVLDEDGNAIIFGIDPSHPLYKTIQCAVLESLALKVVPELRPLSKIFTTDEGKKVKPAALGLFKADKTLRFLSPLDEESSVASKKRAAICSAIVGQHEGPAAGPHEKLEILEDVYRLFFQLELSDRDLSRWPLFNRGSDGVFHRVDGLFVTIESQNYVDLGILRTVCSLDAEISEESIKYDGSRQLVCVEALPKNVFEFLQKKIRVQTLRGRGYNLPVEIEKPPHRVECIEGEHYYLIPAGNKRGKTVMRDGKLFRLKEVPPFERIAVNGETYLATSWQRSEENERAYDEFATVKIHFAPRRFLYSVLYDNSSGRIISTTSIGLAEKDDQGKYLDRRSALCQSIHGRGGMGAFVDPKLKKKLSGVDMSNVREELVEIPVNVGYRQGRFPSLGMYLSSKERTRKLVIATILREMEGKLPADEYAALKEILKQSDDKVDSGGEAVEVELVEEPVEETEVEPDGGIDNEAEEVEGEATEELEIEPVVGPEDETEVDPVAEDLVQALEDETEKAVRDARKAARAEAEEAARDQTRAATRAVVDEIEEEDGEAGENVIYTVLQAKGAYAGLSGSNLRLLPIDDPRHRDFKEIFSLKANEVLVIVITSSGRESISKVSRNLLVKKKRGF